MRKKIYVTCKNQTISNTVFKKSFKKIRHLLQKCIGPTIRIGWEILCLPYTFFFFVLPFGRILPMGFFQGPKEIFRKLLQAALSFQDHQTYSVDANNFFILQQTDNLLFLGYNLDWLRLSKWHVLRVDPRITFTSKKINNCRAIFTEHIDSIIRTQTNLFFVNYIIFTYIFTEFWTMTPAKTDVCCEDCCLPLLNNTRKHSGGCIKRSVNIIHS